MKSHHKIKRVGPRLAHLRERHEPSCPERKADSDEMPARILEQRLKKYARRAAKGTKLFRGVRR